MSIIERVRFENGPADGQVRLLSNLPLKLYVESVVNPYRPVGPLRGLDLKERTFKTLVHTYILGYGQHNELVYYWVDAK